MNFIKRLFILSVLLSVSACARQGSYRQYDGPVVVETGRSVSYVVERPYPVYVQPRTTVVKTIDYRPANHSGRYVPSHRPVPKVYQKQLVRPQRVVQVRSAPTPATRQVEQARRSSERENPINYKSKAEPMQQASYERAKSQRQHQASRSEPVSGERGKNRKIDRDSNSRDERSEDSQRSRNYANIRPRETARNNGSNDRNRR